MGAEPTKVHSAVTHLRSLPRLDLDGIDSLPRIATGTVSIAALAATENLVRETVAALSQHLIVDSVSRVSPISPVMIHLITFNEGAIPDLARIANFLAARLDAAVSASVTFLRADTPGNLGASVFDVARRHGIFVPRLIAEDGRIQIVRFPEGEKPFDTEVTELIGRFAPGHGCEVVLSASRSSFRRVISRPIDTDLEQGGTGTPPRASSNGSINFPRLTTGTVGFVALKEIEAIVRETTTTMFPGLRVSSVRWESPAAPIFIHFSTFEEASLYDIERITSRLAFDLDATVAGSVTVMSPDTPANLAVSVLSIAREHGVIVSRICPANAQIEISRSGKGAAAFDAEVTERIGVNYKGKASLNFSDSFVTPAIYFRRPAARLGNVKICGNPVGAGDAPLPVDKTNGSNRGNPAPKSADPVANCPVGYTSPVDLLTGKFEETLVAAGGAINPDGGSLRIRIEFTGTHLLLERAELHAVIAKLAKVKGATNRFSLNSTIAGARDATKDWPNKPKFLATEDGKTPNIVLIVQSLTTGEELALLHRMVGRVCRFDHIKGA